MGCVGVGMLLAYQPLPAIPEPVFVLVSETERGWPSFMRIRTGGTFVRPSVAAFFLMGVVCGVKTAMDRFFVDAFEFFLFVRLAISRCSEKQ